MDSPDIALEFAVACRICGAIEQRRTENPYTCRTCAQARQREIQEEREIFG
jgi:hypothetical protein